MSAILDSFLSYCRLNVIFQIMTISSKTSHSDISVPTLFQILKNICSSIQTNFYVKKLKIFEDIFVVFIPGITSQVQWFYKFWWLYRKAIIKIYQKQSELYSLPVKKLSNSATLYLWQKWRYLYEHCMKGCCWSRVWPCISV